MKKKKERGIRDHQHCENISNLQMYIERHHLIKYDYNHLSFLMNLIISNESKSIHVVDVHAIHDEIDD
jgi:hypothetical protein